MLSDLYKKNKYQAHTQSRPLHAHITFSTNTVAIGGADFDAQCVVWCNVS